VGDFYKYYHENASFSTFTPEIPLSKTLPTNQLNMENIQVLLQRLGNFPPMMGYWNTAVWLILAEPHVGTRTSVGTKWSL
jgi:hypothetical protein